MFIKTPLPFVQEFVAELHAALEKYQPRAGLSRLQRYWLSVLSDGDSGLQFSLLGQV